MPFALMLEPPDYLPDFFGWLKSRRPSAAGIYLRRSISKISRGESSIIRFNDSRSGYGEIRAAILLARKLAREVADGQAA